MQKNWGETKIRTGVQNHNKIIVGSSLMATHLLEEMRRLQNLVCRLATEIDLKNQRIEYMEERPTQLSTSLSIMTDERDNLNQANIELSMTLCRVTEGRDQLNQAHLEEMRNMQRIVYENETLRRELETHRRELEQQQKEIEKREAQLDLKSKQLSVLNKEVYICLDCHCHTGYKKAKYCAGNLEGVSRGENMQAQIEVDNFCKNLEEKDYELDSLINLNNTLIAKECRSNHELQEAHKVLIEGLDGFANVCSHPAIGLKRMGELNDKPFRDICIKMFPTTEWETKSAELCSLWQHKIQDSGWFPYKHVTIDKKIHEVINEDDEKLRELKENGARKYMML